MHAAHMSCVFQPLLLFHLFSVILNVVPLLDLLLGTTQQIYHSITQTGLKALTWKLGHFLTTRL